MMTLVIAGIVCIVSLFSFLRGCSTNVEEWKEISPVMREITLADCDILNFNMDFKNSTGNYVFIKGKSDVVFMHCDTIDKPVLVVSETFADGVEFTTGNDNEMIVNIHPAGSLYVCDEPMAITLLLPDVPGNISVSVPNSFRTKFKDFATDSLNITLSDWTKCSFYNDTIDFLNIRNNGDAKFFDSNIASLHYNGTGDNNQINIIAEEGSTVKSLELTGGKYECDVRGIDTQCISVIPDSASWINLLSIYKYGD
ncbi:MAG: hypothetical protein K2G40_06310 [Muribaculaceae bacterium]|nr:hypothetical protein [Muribaculaceae bacterium]